MANKHGTIVSMLEIVLEFSASNIEREHAFTSLEIFDRNEKENVKSNNRIICKICWVHQSDFHLIPENKH